MLYGEISGNKGHHLADFRLKCTTVLVVHEHMRVPLNPQLRSLDLTSNRSLLGT